MININREVKRYKCTLEVLSPIHIGSGNTLQADSYVIKEKKYFRLSFPEYFEKLSEKEKTEVIKMLEEGNIINLRKYLRNHYKEEYGYIYKAKVSELIMKDYLDKFEGARNKNENKTFEIEEFINSEFCNYIPGSSIKGAIRTAFMGSEFQENPSQYYIERNKDKNDEGELKISTIPFREIKEKSKKEENEKILANLIGLERNEPKADPFKNLYVSDTNKKEKGIRIESVERWSNKKGKGSSFYHEVLDWESENTYNFQILIKKIQIEQKVMENLLSKRKEEKLVNEIKNLGIGILFGQLNCHAKKMIEADKNFFKKMNNVRNKMETIKKAEEVLKFYESLEKEYSSLKENEALIRIGKGGGFNSKTINLFGKKEEVFSVNLIDNYTMGWAKISYQEG